MSILNSLIEIQEFATLPPVATKILKMLDDDNSSLKEIAQVVETDAALTLKLLRVANSPIYSVKTEIMSIHQAIMILGLNRLTNIVLGISIFSKFLLTSQKGAASLMEKFWWHSSCTGITSKAITTRFNLQFKEIEFIGGLLHDIGKLAIFQYDPAKYAQVLEMVENKGMSDVEAERLVFGADHLQVGEQIARLWKMPEELVSVLGYHSRLDELEEHRELAAIVRLSDVLCEIWDAGLNEGLKQVDIKNDTSWKILVQSYPELKGFDFEAMTFELEEEFKKAAEFLNILVQ